MIPKKNIFHSFTVKYEIYKIFMSIFRIIRLICGASFHFLYLQIFFLTALVNFCLRRLPFNGKWFSSLIYFFMVIFLLLTVNWVCIRINDRFRVASFRLICVFLFSCSSFHFLSYSFSALFLWVNASVCVCVFAPENSFMFIYRDMQVKIIHLLPINI